MKLLIPPFVSKLVNANRILIAGAGGGFDIFCGLPLYFSLISQGKDVFLANLSFTYLRQFEGDWLTSDIMKVTPDTKGITGSYFPEWYLSKWFEQKTESLIPIFAFERTGVLPLTASYQVLIKDLNIDTLILVDGGTDSLMKGNEDGLGTPSEDLLSLAAVLSLNIPQKILMCLGFGVDHFHGVSNDLTFAAIAELTETGCFLGSTSLLVDMPEVQKYREAAEYVFSAMPYNISIVSSSILSALNGHYGDFHTTIAPVK